jgi:integrase
MKVTIFPRGASFRLRIETRDRDHKRVHAYETVRGSALDAEARRLEILRAHEANVVVQPSDETLAAFTARWIDGRALDGEIAETTAELYRTQLAPVLSALGDRPVAQITTAELRAALARRRAIVAVSTARTAHAIIRSLFNAAAAQRLIARSPAADVPPPKGAAAQKKALTADQVRELLAHAADRPLLRRVLVLAISAGLRRGEIAGLRWRDVDLARGTLAIERQIVRVGGLEMESQPKSAAGERVVAIPADIVDELRADAGAPDEPVVCTSLGTRPTLAYLSKLVKDTLLAIGLDEGYSLHSTRHTHATHLLRSSRNLKAISRRLGHSDVNVTQRIYAKVLDGDDEELAAAISDVMA